VKINLFVEKFSLLIKYFQWLDDVSNALSNLNYTEWFKKATVLG